MSLEEIKSFILLLEAEKKNEKEESRAKRVNTNQKQTQESICHPCNGNGHWAKDLHLQDCGQCCPAMLIEIEFFISLDSFREKESRCENII